MDKSLSLEQLAGQAPPYSMEAEQSVLGAVLADPSRLAAVLEYLKPESFYNSYNRGIFSVLMRMFLASQSIDIITVLDRVCREGVFPTEEDAKIYLAKLVDVYKRQIR